MLENMEKMHLETAKVKHLQYPLTKMPELDTKELIASSAQAKMNADLVRQKLSQNLDNFSIRLGHDLANKKCNEIDIKDTAKEKPKWYLLFGFIIFFTLF